MGQKAEKSGKLSGGDDESGTAVFARYALLLFIALAGSFVFYLSLVVTMQILALEAGHDSAAMRSVMAWTTGAVFLLASLPLIHFSVAELPALARTYVMEHLPRGILFVLLALVGGFLMLA
mgnify:CR=1 FL=1